jgi:hypothetical protein
LCGGGGGMIKFSCTNIYGCLVTSHLSFLELISNVSDSEVILGIDPGSGHQYEETQKTSQSSAKNKKIKDKLYKLK